MDRLVDILLCIGCLLNSVVLLVQLRRIKELETILDEQVFDYVGIYSVVKDLKKKIDSKFDLSK